MIITVVLRRRSFSVNGHSAKNLYPFVRLEHLFMQMLLLLNIIESLEVTLILIMALVVENNLRVTLALDLLWRQQHFGEPCDIVLILIEDGTWRGCWLGDHGAPSCYILI